VVVVVGIAASAISTTYCLFNVLTCAISVSFRNRELQTTVSGNVDILVELGVADKDLSSVYVTE